MQNKESRQCDITANDNVDKLIIITLLAQVSYSEAKMEVCHNESKTLVFPREHHDLAASMKFS